MEKKLSWHKTFESCWWVATGWEEIPPLVTEAAHQQQQWLVLHYTGKLGGNCSFFANILIFICTSYSSTIVSCVPAIWDNYIDTIKRCFCMSQMFCCHDRHVIYSCDAETVFFLQSGQPHHYRPPRGVMENMCHWAKPKQTMYGWVHVRTDCLSVSVCPSSSSALIHSDFYLAFFFLIYLTLINPWTHLR